MKKKILDLLKMVGMPFVFFIICYGCKEGLKVFIEVYSSLTIVLFIFLLTSFLFFKSKKHLKRDVFEVGIAALIFSSTLFLAYPEKNYFFIMLGVFATIAILISIFFKWF